MISELEARFSIWPNSTETAQVAAQLRSKYRFSFFDCLMIASAMEAECAILYSEDLQHNQVIERKLQIVNPLV